jgi:hypothetical protein
MIEAKGFFDVVLFGFLRPFSRHLGQAIMAPTFPSVFVFLPLCGKYMLAYTC